MSQSDEILELKEKLDAAQLDAAKLRDENGRFRTLMLSNINGIHTTDPIYIAQKRQTWMELPIEDILTFLDVFQAHTQIFHEIATEKKGKGAIKDHLAKIGDAKIKAVDDYRKNTEAALIGTKVKSIKGAKTRMKDEFQLTEDQAQIWLMMPKDKRAAMRGIMRIVGGHFDAALKMLTSQEESMLKKDA